MSWPDGAVGVVELPDGRRVRGRGLRDPVPLGPRPTFGVYLLNRPPQPFEWDYRWIKWRDFATPTDPREAIDVLRDAYTRAQTERVEIACAGGTGRTGTAIALLAVFAGIRPETAVAWVRTHYRRRAVETPWQRRWIASVGIGTQR